MENKNKLMGLEGDVEAKEQKDEYQHRRLLERDRIH